MTALVDVLIVVGIFVFLGGLGLFAWWDLGELCSRTNECSCDPRWFGLAFDIECPEHGAPSFVSREHEAAA